MTLREWLDPKDWRKRGRITMLAKELRVSVSLVSMWAAGKRRVPAHWCLEIEDVTLGAVKAETLRDDLLWERWKRRRRKSS